MGLSDLWGSPRKPGQVSDLSFVLSRNKPIEKEIIVWTLINVVAVGISFYVHNLDLEVKKKYCLLCALSVPSATCPHTNIPCSFLTIVHTPDSRLLPEHRSRPAGGNIPSLQGPDRSILLLPLNVGRQSRDNEGLKVRDRSHLQVLDWISSLDPLEDERKLKLELKGEGGHVNVRHTCAAENIGFRPECNVH